MSYAGDTDSKRLARYALWTSVQAHAVANGHGELFRRGPIVVLSSRDAGDVGTLLALGVSPAGIVAVDTDKEAIAVARAKFPAVQFVNDDVTNVLGRVRPFATFLDFCGPIGPETSRAIFVAAAVTDQRGSVGAGVMRGRDRSSTTAAPIAAGGVFNRAVRRRLMKPRLMKRRSESEFSQLYLAFANTVFSGKTFDPRPFYAAHRAKVGTGKISASAVRSTFFTLLSTIAGRDAATDSALTISYNGNGVPMLYMMCGAKHPSAEWLVDVPFPTSSQDVRSLAILIAAHQGSAAAALALNLPRPKVSAWLAHETMGSDRRAA